MDPGALPMKETMSGRAWRIYLAGGLTAVALCLVLPLEGLWSSLAYDLIGLSSVAAILVAVRHLRPARPLIWWCFAAGQLLFVIGDMLYAVIDLVLHQSPFPSVADGFYLAGYPVLAAGLLILIRGRISGRDRAGLIDAAIIATGLGLLSWTFLMKPIAADPSLSLLERLISLAYPLGDVLLLALVARLATSPGARTTAYRLLGLALVLLLGADIGYAVLNLVSSYEGGLIDAGWLLSYVVWGTAALHPSMRSLSEVAPDQTARFSHWRLALLATTSLMAPAVLAQQGLRHQPIDVAAIVLSSVVLFLLVVLRMGGLIGKVQDQATQLAALAHNDGLTGIPNRRAWSWSCHGRWPGSDATAAGCMSRCLTWITSNGSTISMATRAGTGCSKKPPPPGRPGYAAPTCWPATAARSSWSCCVTARPSRRSWSWTTSVR
jgi:hypothetical protein